MYLIPNNNRWYNRIAHISPHYRYSITLLALTALLTLWFYGLYNPINRAIAHYTSSIKQAHTQIRHLDHAHISCAQLKTTINSLQQTFNNYKTSHTTDKHLYLHYLLTSAQHAGLTIESYTASITTDKKWYKKHHIHLYLNGTLDHCIAFLTELKNAKKMMFFTQCTLHAITPQQYAIELGLGFIEIV